MDPKPLSFKLNKEQCKKFIQASDPSIRDVCKKLIKKTVYVSFEDFIMALNRVMDEYLEMFEYYHFTMNRPIFIYNPIDITKSNYKYKSNYWITTYIIKRMQKIIEEECPECQIISITDPSSSTEIQEGDTIIFIDDCIYSGSQMGSTIRKFKKYKKLYNFFMMIPYGSLKAKNHIEYVYSNIHDSHDIEIISPPRKKQKGSKQKIVEKNLIFPKQMIKIKYIPTILSSAECKLLNDFYNGGEDRDKFFGINTFLIYFDHKLADPVSVPTLFYLGIVPNNKNKSILKGALNILEISDQLDIIPIINNCLQYTTMIDPYSPKCPYPPYKEGFLTWIEDMKDFNIFRHKSLPTKFSNSNSNSNSSAKRILKSYSK